MGQTVRKTRVRVKKNGKANSGGYRRCNVCRGTGIVQVKKKKK